MARVADNLSPASREAVARILADWLHEKQLDALLREIPAQRPPPQPVPLHELAGRGCAHPPMPASIRQRPALTLNR